MDEVDIRSYGLLRNGVENVQFDDQARIGLRRAGWLERQIEQTAGGNFGGQPDWCVGGMALDGAGVERQLTRRRAAKQSV
jgi:hypothetical protein